MNHEETRLAVLDIIQTIVPDEDLAALKKDPGRLARFLEVHGEKRIEALKRFRGFYVKKGTPQDRLDYLVAACKAGFANEGYAEFNEKKYMHLIDSYRDTEGSIELINNAVATYRDMYEKLGIGN